MSPDRYRNYNNISLTGPIQIVYFPPNFHYNLNFFFLYLLAEIKITKHQPPCMQCNHFYSGFILLFSFLCFPQHLFPYVANYHERKAHFSIVWFGFASSRLSLSAYLATRRPQIQIKLKECCTLLLREQIIVVVTGLEPLITVLKG